MRRPLSLRLACGLGVAVLLFDAVALPADAPSSPLAEYDRLVIDSDREHWAYQPVRKPPVPSVHDTAWARNPIDNFILARLQAKGWQPSATVSRRVLLRRVYLDLVGFPPAPEELNAFLNDQSPDALSRVVDKLLSSPGYGERWGRHWLDLVRFAETNGYERDAIKPHVWRYRDWVIAALNADKPYDRFVLEQLAGDELSDASTQTMIATGYYRLGPWDDEPADPAQDHFDQLDDLVRTTSRVFLGLTLGCSRCHNHKFDALTMHDYYRMVAIFGVLDRPRNGRRERDLPAGSRAELSALAARDRQIVQRRTQIEKLRHDLRSKLLTSGGSKLPAAVLQAFTTEPAKRSAAQKKLVEQHAPQLDRELAAAMPADTKRRIAVKDEQIAALMRQTPDLPRGYFMQERSPNPPKAYLLLRGRAASPGPQVQPGLPTVLVNRQPSFLAPDEETSRRRLTLARWIASSENPLTARVIVNRVWMFHFGEGLVRTPSDFGVMGDDPSHPRLLDWLANWFVQDAGWSLKKLHRLILSSNTYRMSKHRRPDYAQADPENRLFWRFPYRRLEVEAIRDSMLAVSGQLNRKMYGPSTYLSVPKEALDGHSDPDKIWKPLDRREASRRTVYAFIKRSLVVPLLEVLDLCDSTRSSARRNVTSVPTQALTLYNGEFVNRQTRHFAARLQREAGDDPVQQIERAYRLALCRNASSEELTAMTTFLHREADQLQREAAATGKSISRSEADHRALIHMCRVIYNLNEFVYTD